MDRRAFEEHYADLCYKSVPQLKAIGYWSIRCFDRGHCCGWHAVAAPPCDAAERDRLLQRYRGSDPQPFGGPYDDPKDRA